MLKKVSIGHNKDYMRELEDLYGSTSQPYKWKFKK